MYVVLSYFECVYLTTYCVENYACVQICVCLCSILTCMDVFKILCLCVLFFSVERCVLLIDYVLFLIFVILCALLGRGRD